MALSQFRENFSAAASSVLSLAQVCRAVRDGAGDVSVSQLMTLQAQFRAAKVACVRAIQSGASAPDPLTAEAYMREMGGPATLADFTAGMGQVEAAAAAWNTLLEAELATLTGPDLLRLRSVGEPEVEVRILEYTGTLPAAYSNLRASAELAALIATLEMLGA